MLAPGVIEGGKVKTEAGQFTVNGAAEAYAEGAAVLALLRASELEITLATGDSDARVVYREFRGEFTEYGIRLPPATRYEFEDAPPIRSTMATASTSPNAPATKSPYSRKAGRVTPGDLGRMMVWNGVCRGGPRSGSGTTGGGRLGRWGLCMNGLDSSASLGMTFGEGWG